MGIVSLLTLSRCLFKEGDTRIARLHSTQVSRHYATIEYQKTKDTTLDLLYFTGKKDIIESNRLLWIEEDRIHFKFEEINKGEIKWQ